MKLLITLLKVLTFWPIAFISILLNIWLFYSFFSVEEYKVVAGVIGAVVDIFKLYCLFQFDQRLQEYQFDKVKPPKKQIGLGRTHYMKYLIQYLFFMIVSAGASLIFSLIDVDRNISMQTSNVKTQSGEVVNRFTLERAIDAKWKTHADLMDFTTLNEMQARVLQDTNSLRVKTGIMPLEQAKEERRRDAGKVLKEIETMQAQLDNVVIESSGTFEVFEYIASVPIFGGNKKLAMISSVILVIIAIELITSECRGAMAYSVNVLTLPFYRRKKARKRSASYSQVLTAQTRASRERAKESTGAKTRATGSIFPRIPGIIKVKDKGDKK